MKFFILIFNKTTFINNIKIYIIILVLNKKYLEYYKF